MTYRRASLGDGRDNRARQQSWLFASSLAVALTASAFASPEPQALRMVTAAPSVDSASAAEAVVVGSRASSETTGVRMEDLWVTTNGPTWSREPRRIEVPGDVFAGQPLRVDVYATDSKGTPLCNALVELTWCLDGQQTSVSTRTNGLGHMSSNRFVPAGCKGKRCTVSVRVTRDQLEGLAYSTFVMK